MFDLSGKRALITGGSSGIGTAMVKMFAEQGAEVAFSGRDESRLKAVKESVPGAKLYPLVCDFSNLSQVEKMADRAKEALGGVDILVNNAGMNRDKIFMRMSVEDIEDVMRVNFTSAAVLIKKVIMDMSSKRWGRIISVTSVVLNMGNAGQVNYSASKGAVLGMSTSLAKEVAAFGITVNCIAPGMIETPMSDRIPDSIKKNILDAIPTRRFGKAGEAACAAVFLASEEASYITGTTIHVNGGLYENN